MPGDPWRRFATVRLLYTYMFTYPGKKLLFMGSEFAHGREWSVARELDWYLLERPQHRGVLRVVADLNRLYAASAALHGNPPASTTGFEWIDCHASSLALLSYLRIAAEGELMLVVLNFTPTIHDRFRFGVPRAGFYREVFNSDSEYYGGSNVGSGPGVVSDPLPWMGRPHSVELRLPPLGGLVLRLDNPDEAITPS
jgi:1,4-alpha-glucan branching enzyme